MHVLESTATVARRSIRRLVTDTYEDRVLICRITNGTHARLKVVEPRCVGAGTCNLSFAELGPGEAGEARFSSCRGSYASNVASGCHHAGAIELTLGHERLFLGESNPLGQSLLLRSRFSLEFSRDARRTLYDFYSDLPQEFMGAPGGRSITKGKAHTARVNVVSQQNPVEVDVVFLEDEVGEVEYELDSLQQLQFAEWCRESAQSCLGSVIFLIELGAVMRALALKKLDVADKAFALDLLICTFVTSGLLTLCPDTLNMNLRKWQSETRPHDLPLTDRPEYRAYAECDVLPADLELHVDAARLLLRAAALCCTQALREAVDSCKASGQWPKAGSTQECSMLRKRSIPCDSTENTCILAEHLREESLFGSSVGPDSPRTASILSPRSSAPSSSVSSAAGDSLSDVIKAAVRFSIHTSADYAIRRSAILDHLAQQQASESACAALRHYERWLPLSQRHFASLASNAMPDLAFDSLCMEVLGNLDGGRSTSPAVVLDSLGYSAQEYISMATNSKSGEFFFFSKDRRFLIKTISEKEYILLGRLMPAYQEHIRRWPRSLIVRFAGLFHAQVGQKVMHFLVMTSVFDPNCKVHETFDLKGSLHKRKKKKGESIGKDEDWLEGGERRLVVSQAVRRELCAVHELDAMLLTRFKIMDYSVLVGIHWLQDGEDRGKNWREAGGLYSEDGRAVYFVGLIDFSIKYSLKKQAETLINVLKGCDQSASCVSQDTYAMRQVKFVRNHVFMADGGSEDMGTMGMLTVHIIAARNLVAADWRGTSDPYLRVSLGLMSKQTHTVHRDCNPKWDCTLRLPVNVSHALYSVELAVWDEDTNRALRGSDDFLGKLVVPLADVLAGPRDLLNVDLAGVKRGQLSVYLSFQPAASHGLGPEQWS
mmetsp:Transcript_70953/g.164024  ORF Transcript_70953/g.164024 Transcript_70953/m.164024 type:complete len:885 (+) Transcript_70953:64-2718(+)